MFGLDKKIISAVRLHNFDEKAYEDVVLVASVAGFLLGVSLTTFLILTVVLWRSL